MRGHDEQHPRGRARNLYCEVLDLARLPPSQLSYSGEVPETAACPFFLTILFIGQCDTTSIQLISSITTL